MMFALSLQDLELRYLNAIASYYLGTILERRPFDGHGHSGTLNDDGRDYTRDSTPASTPATLHLRLRQLRESLWPLFS